MDEKDLEKLVISLEERGFSEVVTAFDIDGSYVKRNLFLLKQLLAKKRGETVEVIKSRIKQNDGKLEDWEEEGGLAKQLDQIVKNQYLYPLLTSLVIGEPPEYVSDGDTYNRGELRRLLDNEKDKTFVHKIAALECLFGFNYYLVEANKAVERIKESDCEPIKTVVPPGMDHKSYSMMNLKKRFRDMTDKHAKDVYELSCELSDVQKLPVEAQEYKDVTDLLLYKVSDNYKKKLCSVLENEKTKKEFSELPNELTGNMNIDKAIVKDGKKVYAFIGPKVDKWVLNKNRKWLTNEDGEPFLDLNAHIILLSLICAPYLNRDETKDSEHDLRFIADSEIFDIQEDGSIRDKNGKLITYEPENKGAKCHYGFLKENFASVREKLFPEVDGKHAVYVMTASPDNPDETINCFINLYNKLIRGGLSEIGGNGPEMDNEGYDIEAKKVEHVKDILQRYFDNVDSYLVEDVANFAVEHMHDKIPYSFIGSLIKQKEYRTIELLTGFHPQEYEDDFTINPLFKVEGMSFRDTFILFQEAGEYQEKARKLFYKLSGKYVKDLIEKGD